MMGMSAPGQRAGAEGIVSVLIPAYKHEGTIVRALDSVLLSDCAAIELIVSDDASSDRTAEAAAAWVAAHRAAFYRAEVIKQPRNLGLTCNLNFLLNAASGEFITAMASDDEFAAAAIDAQRRYLQAHPDKDFVFPNMGIIDGDSRVLSAGIVGSRRARMLRSRAWSILDMVFNWGPPWSRVFGRRDAFLALGGYVEEHAFEDRWGALAIARTGRFGYLDVPGQLFRVRGADTATGGVAQERLDRDMQDVEERLKAGARGLLWLCLRARTGAFRKPGRSPVPRLFWAALCRTAENVVRRGFGSSSGAIERAVREAGTDQ